MRNRMLFVLVVLGLCGWGLADDRLVVHEWGTFTALQDEQGRALGGINTHDERVPAFVHQMFSAFFPPTVLTLMDGKGVPAGDPNVTMLLETPVMYFHAPRTAAGPSETGPIKVDVSVEFRGGWLTQYFPDALAEIDGKTAATPPHALAASTIGRLTWRGLLVGSQFGAQPKTSEHVWTAPREAASEAVSLGNEREQFLFYRGVGHLDAPVRVTRDSTASTLQIHGTAAAPPVGPMWLVDIRPDGAVAFRAIGGIAPGAAVTCPAEFAAADYSTAHLATLRSAMRQALVAQGLFSDEADAMLDTWQLSYFQDPGERLFFMVPQAWTAAALPLTISPPAQVTRVMVGRLELVTPAQRKLIEQMAATPPADVHVTEIARAMQRLGDDPQRVAAYNALAGGRGNLSDLGVAIPSIYADFLALGRFRTPLLRDYIAAHRDPRTHQCTSAAMMELSAALTGQ